MQTLTINSKAHQVLARAAEKARQEKPLVRKTSTYGWYLVRSATDMTRWYSVVCNSQTHEITCNCPATKPCFHIAAVAPIHVYIARQLRESQAASQAAPAGPVVHGVITTSTQELDSLIEQACEEVESLDRECPVCGLVQPDDDSSDCWCCGSTLDPDDLDPEYTDEMAAFDTACLFG